MKIQHAQTAEPEEWHRRARCLRLRIPQATFFPENNTRTTGMIVNICGRCPVVADCLADALAVDKVRDNYATGWYAATSPKARLRLRKIMAATGATIRQVVEFRLGVTAELIPGGNVAADVEQQVVAA